MLFQIVVGIQQISKNEKEYYILHTVTENNVEGKNGFVGKQTANIFVKAELMPKDLKVGSKVRIYYDNVGGKAYLSGIEVCK